MFSFFNLFLLLTCNFVLCLNDLVFSYLFLNYLFSNKFNFIRLNFSFLKFSQKFCHMFSLSFKLSSELLIVNFLTF